MKKSLFIALAIILVCGIISSSCAQSKTTSTTAAAQATTTTPTLQPKYGGILKVISRGNGPLNMGLPGVAGSPSDPNCGRPAVEKLMSLDTKGELIPYLATSWEYSTDYKSLTFHLRKGIKFHDGTDFNAEAVKFCLDMVRVSPATGSNLRVVKSIDAVDDSTVRLNLDSYDAALLFSIQANCMMVSPTAVKALGDEAKVHPVGTGPFKFVSYKRDQLLKFEKFDGYWQKGKPYLDGIDRVFIADPVTAVASFKAGEGHMLTDLPASDVAALNETGQYITTSPWAAVSGFCGDSINPDSPFANIKVRQAIAYAVDNAAIAKVVGYGFYSAVNQIAPPDSWYYNPKVVGYPYNPQKAKQLLTEAGYPNGFSTTITFRSDTRWVDTFTAVQSFIGKIGIDAKLDAADSARLLQVQSKGWKNGLVVYDNPASTGYDPGTAFMNNLSSTRSRFVSVAVPDVFITKLLQANVDPDNAKRKVSFQELQKIMVDDYCILNPLFASTNTAVKVKYAHDLNLAQDSWHEWNPENTWIEK